MKKTLFLFLLLFGSLNLFANDPDTLDVPPVYVNSAGELKIALAHYIVADTNEAGERKNPNRVYRLQRYRDENNQGIYVLDYGMDIDFSLRLVAEKGEGRLPMIIPEYNSTGSVLGYLFNFISNNESHKFENIFFQRINLDREFKEGFLSGLIFAGDSTRIEFTGCVFNAFTGRAVHVTGEDNSIFLRDNVWRNGEWPIHPWVGQQNNFGSAHIDTLVMTNNTYYNNNAYFVTHLANIIDLFIFEHNTIFTSISDAINTKYLVNANIRSNLFYGYAAYGDTEFARTSGSWYEFDGDSLAHISFDELGRLASIWGKSESERTINVTNNAYYTPQKLQDYYADFANYDPPHTGVDPVTPPLWMNERTRNMFDDEINYPFLTEFDNIGNVDPQFANTDMDAWTTNAVAQWCRDSRNTSTSDGWGTSVHRNYDQYLGDDILTGIQWPLPEGNMEITNPILLTAGHDGLPVGNLNWNPALRAQYVEPNSVEKNPISRINKDDAQQTPTEYVLAQNYPNPFNPTTTINFSIPKRGITTLKIFNILGQEVATLVNEELNVGSYKYIFNASRLTTGVYIYKLKSNSYSKVKKMILVK